MKKQYTHQTTNRECRQYVEQLKPFQANNLHGVNEGRFYVVLSYGWYPIFAYDYHEKEWYENIEGFSAATKRQISQARPHTFGCRMVTAAELREILGHTEKSA